MFYINIVECVLLLFIETRRKVQLTQKNLCTLVPVRQKRPHGVKIIKYDYSTNQKTVNKRKYINKFSASIQSMRDSL